MGALADYRERVATALAPGPTDDWTVSAGPVDSFTPPGYLLTWTESSDWLMPSTFCAHEVRLDVLVISYRIDPDPGLERCEELVEYALAQFDAGGLPLAFGTSPRPFQIGGVPYLAARLTLALPLKLT